MNIFQGKVGIKMKIVKRMKTNKKSRTNNYWGYGSQLASMLADKNNDSYSDGSDVRTLTFSVLLSPIQCLKGA